MTSASKQAIGVIVALPEERKALEDLLKGHRIIRRRGGVVMRGKFHGQELVILQCGVGPDKAERATEWLIDDYGVTCVITVGFAGGLDKALTVGDLVVADRAIDARTRETYAYENGLPQVPTAQRGAVVTVDRVYATAEEKRHLAREFRALAVDMESSSVAKVSLARGIPWCSLRVVLDTLEADLPVRSRREAALALLRPRQVRRLLQLARNSRHVSRRLAVGFVALLAHVELMGGALRTSDAAAKSAGGS